jgi:hypothetical protein
MFVIPVLKPKEWTAEEREIEPGMNMVFIYVPFDGNLEAFDISRRSCLALVTDW